MTRLRRFVRLPPAERSLLLRAALLLWGIRLGLWLLSLRALRRILGRLTRPSVGWRRPLRSSPEQIAWAARVASRYVPKATCLIQALAVQRLLEQEGHPACLRVGVAKGDDARLLAHAWVESEGRVVVGDAELERYTRLLALDGEPPSASARRDGECEKEPRGARFPLFRSRRS